MLIYATHVAGTVFSVIRATFCRGNGRVERMSLCMFVAFHLKCFENIPIEIFVKFINADYVLCVAMDIFLCGKTCLHARMIPLNSPNCWHLGLFL